jgi:hypothetical protein
MQVVLISKKSWSVPKKDEVDLKYEAKKGPWGPFFYYGTLGFFNPSRQKGDLFGAKVEVIGSYQVVVDFVFDPV